MCIPCHPRRGPGCRTSAEKFQATSLQPSSRLLQHGSAEVGDGKDSKRPMSPRTKSSMETSAFLTSRNIMSAGLKSRDGEVLQSSGARITVPSVPLAPLVTSIMKSGNCNQDVAEARTVIHAREREEVAIGPTGALRKESKIGHTSAVEVEEMKPSESQSPWKEDTEIVSIEVKSTKYTGATLTDMSEEKSNKKLLVPKVKVESVGSSRNEGTQSSNTTNHVSRPMVPKMNTKQPQSKKNIPSKTVAVMSPFTSMSPLHAQQSHFSHPIQEHFHQENTTNSTAGRPLEQLKAKNIRHFLDKRGTIQKGGKFVNSHLHTSSRTIRDQPRGLHGWLLPQHLSRQRMTALGSLDQRLERNYLVQKYASSQRSVEQENPAVLIEEYQSFRNTGRIVEKYQSRRNTSRELSTLNRLSQLQQEEQKQRDHFNQELQQRLQLLEQLKQQEGIQQQQQHHQHHRLQQQTPQQHQLWKQQQPPLQQQQQQQQKPLLQQQPLLQQKQPHPLLQQQQEQQETPLEQKGASSQLSHTYLQSRPQSEHQQILESKKSLNVNVINGSQMLEDIDKVPSVLARKYTANKHPTVNIGQLMESKKNADPRVRRNSMDLDSSPSYCMVGANYEQRSWETTPLVVAKPWWEVLEVERNRTCRLPTPEIHVTLIRGNGEQGRVEDKNRDSLVHILYNEVAEESDNGGNGYGVRANSPSRVDLLTPVMAVEVKGKFSDVSPIYGENSILIAPPDNETIMRGAEFRGWRNR